MEWLERHARLVTWLALAATFAVYAPTLANGFPFDDAHLVQPVDASGMPRPLVAGLRPLGAYFSSHYWAGYYPAGNLYRPLTVLSFALVHVTLGQVVDSAFAQHLVNVLLHVWTTWLVWRFACALTRQRLASLVAALVFGLHAVHTEAVANIVGRAEILGFAFGLQALLLLMHEQPRSWRHAASAVLCFLAFCCKESALAWVAMLPLAVLARGLAADGRAPWRAAVRALLVSLPGLALFLFLRWRMLQGVGEVPAVAAAANPLVLLPTAQRVLTAISILGFALGKVLFPIRLAADYGPAVFAPVVTITDPRFLASASILAALLVVAALSARRRPIVALAIASFFGFSFITSNVPFAIGTVFAERLLYMPSVGLALFAAWCAERVRAHADQGPPQTRHISAAPLGVVLLLWLAHNAVYSFRRSSMWKNTDTIALHDVRVQPDSANLQRLASAAYVSRGDLPSAILCLESAARLAPSFAASWLNLGTLLWRQGNKQRAAAAWRDGLRRADPAMKRELASLHKNLVLFVDDRLDAARRAIRRGDKVVARQILESVLAAADGAAAQRARASELLRGL